MATTRAKTAALRTRKQIYAARVRASPCRKQTSKCRDKYGCKFTKAGKRKTYCRKLKNRHA